MFVYFYHRENLAHYAKKYPISQYELKILKKFLVKKLVKDKRKFKALKIQALNQENYIDFLIKNPALYRKNIIRSKLFKRIVKRMKAFYPDFHTRYMPFCNIQNYSIFQTLDTKKAHNLMTNEFYQSCFENQLFNTDFSSFLNDNQIVKEIISESKRKFTKRIDSWINVFSKNISERDFLVESNCSLKLHLNSSRDEVEKGKRRFLEFINLVNNPNL